MPNDRGTTVDCLYQLFVYALPAGFRKNGRGNPKRSLGTRALNEQNGDPYMDSIDGAAVLPDFPEGVKVWNSAQFSTAQLVYERALTHRCRTNVIRSEGLPSE